MMALRLFEAKDSSGPVFASQVTAEDSPFTCRYCPVDVIWVEDHWVHKEDVRLKRHVPAFFRLPPHQEHASACQQTVAGALDIVMQEASAVEDGAEPAFEAAGDKNLFRLNIPTLLARRPEGPAPERPFPERIRSVWRQGPLENYCRSAVGLAIIWNALDLAENRDELQAKLSVAVDGKIVPWHEFSFSPKRYNALRKQLSKPKRHPVAVLVSIKSAEKLDDGRYRVRCVAERTMPKGPDVRVAPVIFASAEAFKKLRKNKQFIAFGDWYNGQTKPYDVPDSKKVILYHNVVLNVERAAQIGEIQVPGEREKVTAEVAP